MNSEHTQGVASIYCDGGVLKKNPSTFGGTYAFFLLDESGAEAGNGSGFVLPLGSDYPPNSDCWECDLELISNNVTELVAVVSALQQVPDDFRGILYSDSHVTLCRMRFAKSWAGVPDSLKSAALTERKRHPNLSYVLLDGHPTKDQLAAKIGKRGNPCSEWNVKCDTRCGELSKHFFSIKETP